MAGSASRTPSAPSKRESRVPIVSVGADTGTRTGRHGQDQLHSRRSEALSGTHGHRLSGLPSWPCRFDPGHPLHRIPAQGRDSLRHRRISTDSTPRKSRQRRRNSPSLKAGHVRFRRRSWPSDRDSQGAAPDVRTGDSRCCTGSITHRSVSFEIPRLPTAASRRAAVHRRTATAGSWVRKHGNLSKRAPRVPIVSLGTTNSLDCTRGGRRAEVVDR